MADPVRSDVSEVEDGPEYDLDFRAHPERYRHTPDERGAFETEPQEWYDGKKREIALVYEEYLARVRDDDADEKAKERHHDATGTAPPTSRGTRSPCR